MWVQNEGLGAFAAQRVGGPVRRLVIAIITATPFPIELTGFCLAHRALHIQTIPQHGREPDQWERYRDLRAGSIGGRD